MAERGAQPGNQNAAKGRKWRDAILRALARKAGSVDQGLDSAADKLVALMIDGEPADRRWAIDHAADRIDGKPAQAIVGGDDGDNPIRTTIEFRIVEHKAPD